MKTFSDTYTDKNDGVKIKSKVKVSVADLRKDLGNKFVFIDVEYIEPDRTITETISVPFKSIPKLIKSLREVAKGK